MSRNSMLNTAVHRDYLQLPSTDQLALPDVLAKTGACLAVTVIAAIPGWIFLAGSLALYVGLLVATLIAGVWMARKAPIPAWMALGYSALLGLIMGAFSHSAVAVSTGGTNLVLQAVIGTMAGTIGMLVIYQTPWGKRASRSVQLFAGIALGYFLIALASAGAAIFFGAGGGWGFYGMGPLGLVLCLVGVALACWSLLVDIGEADLAIQNGAPRELDWTLGVALAASVVWLYMEILRFLAISSSD